MKTTLKRRSAKRCTVEQAIEFRERARRTFAGLFRFNFSDELF
jgi:hypothetical protein